MESDVDLLILEEPTIGVDVGSKAEIYRDLDLAHERGRAVLLVSSDFEEVEKICHRALVFDRGKIVAEIRRPEINVASLTALVDRRPRERRRPPRECSGRAASRPGPRRRRSSRSGACWCCWWR